MSARRLVILVLAVLAGSFRLAGAARADVGATFGMPQLIDAVAPFGSPLNVSVLSCAPATSSAHCAALGTVQGGVVDESTTDTAGTSSVPTWSLPAEVNLAAFTPSHMTCPTSTLCVAVGTETGTTTTSDVTVSQDGGPTWSAPIPLETEVAGDPIDGLACTTSGECVAVDALGAVFSGDAVEGGAWQVDTVPTGLTFSKPEVACSGGNTCVITVVDNQAIGVLISTDVGPTDAAPSWNLVSTKDKATAEAVSCAPQGTTCVVLDSKKNAVVSTSPAATKVWTAFPTADANTLQAVSCPSNDECVITDQSRASVVATGLTTASPSFTQVAVNSQASPLSCPSTTWCVGGLGSAITYAQVDPSAPSQTAWSPVQDLTGTNQLTELACSSSGGLCAAGDSEGRVTISSDDGVQWSTPAAPSGLTGAPAGLSCTSDGMCVVLSNRAAYVETDGVPTWSSGASLMETGSIDGLSCASEQLCVAVDSAGNALVSTDPANATPTWTPTATGAPHLDSISCPSTSLCVAGDNAGDVISSTDPAAGGWSVPQSVDSEAITALSCESSGQCLAGDSTGEVLQSPDVSQGADSWSSPTDTDSGTAILSLACTAAGDNACVGTTGSLTAGGSPVGGPSDVSSGDWSAITGAPADLIRVACPSDGSCLWSDAGGDVVTSAVATGVATLSANTLAFGTEPMNETSADQTVTVTDSGPAPLSISGWTLAGPDSGSFFVDSDACTGTTLTPGSSCAIGVAFAPTLTGPLTGPLTADLQIESDDPTSPADVALSGTGTPAQTTSTAPITRRRNAPTNGRARFTRAAVTGTMIDAIVLCEGRAGTHCATRLRLTAHEHLRGRQLVSVSDARRASDTSVRMKIRPITLASGRATLTASRGRVVHLALDATGRRVLRQLGKLRATLTATQTVAGKTVRTRRFHLSFSTHHHR